MLSFNFNVIKMHKTKFYVANGVANDIHPVKSIRVDPDRFNKSKSLLLTEISCLKGIP